MEVNITPKTRMSVGRDSVRALKPVQDAQNEWKPFSHVRLCTVHGTLQTRILEWVAFPFSRGSSQPRGRTQVSLIAGKFFTSWATWEAPYPSKNLFLKSNLELDTRGQYSTVFPFLYSSNLLISIIEMRFWKWIWLDGFKVCETYVNDTGMFGNCPCIFAARAFCLICVKLGIYGLI